MLLGKDPLSLQTEKGIKTMNEKSKIFFPDKIKSAFFIKGGVVFLLSFFLFTSAFGAPQNENSPFSEQLKAPPTFIPEFMTEKENATALYSDGIYTVYTTDKAITNQDKLVSVTASQITHNNWSFGVEARRSPILEQHGNVERNESMGGIIKGTFHF